MLLPDKMEEELKLNIPFFQPLKSEKSMGLSKHGIDIRNAMSFWHTGMSFDEFAYEKIQEVEALKKEVKREADAAVAATNAAEIKAKEAAKEAEAKAIKSVKAMIALGKFSIETIADVLDLDVDYAKQLAANNPTLAK